MPYEKMERRIIPEDAVMSTYRHWHHALLRPGCEIHRHSVV